jgi:hypothetical protein
MERLRFWKCAVIVLVLLFGGCSMQELVREVREAAREPSAPEREEKVQGPPYHVKLKFYKALEEFETPHPLSADRMSERRPARLDLEKTSLEDWHRPVVDLSRMGEENRYRPGSEVWIPDEEVVRLKGRGVLVPISRLRVVLVHGNEEETEVYSDRRGDVSFRLLSGEIYHLRVYFGTHEWFSQVFERPFWVGMVGKIEGEESKKHLVRSVLVSPGGDIRRKPY